jgi:hypothetical protein
MDDFPDFFAILKRKVLYEYITGIRKPLLNLKHQDIEHYDTRADFQQVLALRNYDDNEISNLISDEIDQKTE